MSASKNGNQPAAIKSNIPDKKLSCLAVFGIVALVVILLVMIGYALYYICNRYRKKKKNGKHRGMIIKRRDNELIIEPVTITKGNFNDHQHGTYILLFHASWCHHCKDFIRRTNNFQDFVNKHPGRLLLLDPFEAGMDGLIEQVNIKGFPAICVIKDGRITEHHVAQTTEALVELYEAHA